MVLEVLLMLDLLVGLLLVRSALVLPVHLGVEGILGFILHLFGALPLI